MSNQVTLQAEPRAISGKAVRHLRREGILPANLTGRHMEPLAIQVKTLDVTKMLKGHGRTTVIRLYITPESEPRTVMIGHIQRDPVSAAIEHIDFLLIAMTEKMRARIALRTLGVAPAVASNVGVLLQMVNQVEVEALPDNLPQSIAVDISDLKNVDDTIFVRDLKVSPQVILHGDPDEPIIKIVQTRAALEATTIEAVEPAAVAAAEESSGS
jgi:large subunit ribosomal protein L25